MALKGSTMLLLGTPLPDIELPDVRSEQVISLANIARPQPTLVMFICRHCPYVVHVQAELAKLGKRRHPRRRGLPHRPTSE